MRVETSDGGSLDAGDIAFDVHGLRDLADRKREIDDDRTTDSQDDVGVDNGLEAGAGGLHGVGAHR